MAYVLSYAPVVRLCDGPDPEFVALYSPIIGHIEFARSNEYWMFTPVDWMIDNTALQEPAFLWAHLWGVRVRFEQRRTERVFAPVGNEDFWQYEWVDDLE